MIRKKNGSNSTSRIDFATKEYNSIAKYIQKIVHHPQNIVRKQPEVVQIIYQPLHLILSENTIHDYECEEFASYEEIAQLETHAINEVEDLQLSEKEKEILFSCINFLNEGNIIEVIDKTIQKEYCNYTTRELYPLSQVSLIKLLAILLKEKKIRIRTKCKQLDFVKSVADNMQLKRNEPLNFDSFKTEFNRRLKAEKISWSTLNSSN